MRRVIGDYDKVQFVQSEHGDRAFRITLCVIIAAIVTVVTCLVISCCKTPSKCSTPTKQVYLVTVGDYEDMSVAAMVASDIIGRGGGGYVFNDGKLHVILQTYLSQDDANAVAKRMSDMSAEVMTITYPSISFPLEWDKQLCLTAARFIQYPYEYMERLYDMIVRLDKGETSESVVLYELVAIGDEVTVMNENLTEFSHSQGVDMNAISKVYDVILGGIDYMSELQGERCISTKAKYTICELAVRYKMEIDKIKI